MYGAWIINIFNFYRPQTKFARVMLLHASVSPFGERAYMAGGCAWQGGSCVVGCVHGKEVCMAGCMVGKCAWQEVCMAGGHAWQGVWVAGGACVACIPPTRYYEIQSMSGQYASYWNAFLLSIKIHAM